MKKFTIFLLALLVLTGCRKPMPSEETKPIPSTQTAAVETTVPETTLPETFPIETTAETLPRIPEPPASEDAFVRELD